MGNNLVVNIPYIEKELFLIFFMFQVCLCISWGGAIYWPVRTVLWEAGWADLRSASYPVERQFNYAYALARCDAGVSFSAPFSLASRVVHRSSRGERA